MLASVSGRAPKEDANCDLSGMRDLHVCEVRECVPLKDAGSNVCQHLEAEMEAGMQTVAGQKRDPSRSSTLWQCLGVGVAFALL